MKKNNVVLACVITGAVCAAASGLSVKYHYRKQSEFYDKYSLIYEAETIMKDSELSYPENANFENSIINGYLSAFDDPYTYYYMPEKSGTKESVVESVNRFPVAQGMGFTLAYNDSGELYFSDVINGMPASAQGVQVGDIITSIDGDKASESEYNFARKINGDDGTELHLDIRRGDEDIELSLRRVCADFHDVGIEVESRMYESVKYIRIKHFEQLTPMYVEDFLSQDDYKSLIIDLREDLGGGTNFCMLIAGKLIREGFVEQFSYNGDYKKLEVQPTDSVKGVPIVVLVNENTASSAEILTALLKQYGDAVIVGTNTYGKGVFQEETELSNGGILHYTVGYYTVGDWECYQGKGITPDVEVDMNSDLIGTKGDVQLLKALELLG